MDIQEEAELLTERYEKLTNIAKFLWNAQADEYNQWDNLGLDEKLDLIGKVIDTYKGEIHVS